MTGPIPQHQLDQTIAAARDVGWGPAHYECAVALVDGLIEKFCPPSAPPGVHIHVDVLRQALLLVREAEVQIVEALR